MGDIMNEEQDPAEPTPKIETAEMELEALPILVSNKDSKSKKKSVMPKFSRRAILLPLMVLLLLIGSVIGAYTQPAWLQLILKKTGIELGEGSGQAMPLKRPKPEMSAPSGPEKSHTVVALGKLIPRGDVTIVAMPYGAGDARINSLNVKIGQHVSRGQILAVLDNRSLLQSTVKATQANVALKRSMLTQTRSSIVASLNEANAVLGRAQIAAKMAHKNFKRQEELFEQAVISESSLDDASLKMQETQRDLEKAEATLFRYKSKDINQQPDVQVATYSLSAIQAELNRAQQDLVRSVVTAPISGTVLDIHVRPGEKPGNSGLVDIGDTDHMTAELEVYQADIAHVKVGQHVKLRSDALKIPLKGQISTIGFLVGRQTQLGNDPAANTDARVIKVTVDLDPASSVQATRFTYLEVVARIAIEDKL